MSDKFMRGTDNVESDAAVRAIGFLLIDDFALMSFAAAIEPLRAANWLSGRNLYRWRSFAADAPVFASAGIGLDPDGRVGDLAELDTLFVCAGGNPALFRDRATLTWLRRLAGRGVRLGGVSGGPFILARAGLLAGRRCTIHWEHVPAFVEAFPEIELTRSLYEIDRDRLTCAGGIAALDMMHALIAEHHGRALADAVADWFLQNQVRSGAGDQRRSPAERFGTADTRLVRVLQAIEASPERPPSRSDLAAIAGLSVRQLERLVAAELGTSLDRYSLRLRLQRARALLRQSRMPIVEAALACGFGSASHFSRSYKAAFGLAPRDDRRPELAQLPR